MRWLTQHRAFRRAALAALVPLVFFWPGGDAPQQKKTKAAAPAGSAAAPAEPAVPFRVGETLRYRVAWSYFSAAASVELRLRERRPFYGRQAWHFQATATTNQPVRSIYELDDQFDSYTDTRTLATLQWEMYVREQGQQQNRVVRLTTEGQPSWGNGPSVRVPAGTRDPLALIYYFRTVDWARQPAVRSPVYDGRKLYEARAQVLERQGRTSVPAGAYQATRVGVRLYERGQEVRGTAFELWLADDAARTPVLMTARLPFGELRVELREPPR